MSSSVKIEAAYQVDRSILAFQIKLPHTAPSYADVSIAPGAYPTHRHLAIAIEAAVAAATTYGPTVSGVSGDFYVAVGADGRFTLKSDTMQMVVSFVSAEALGADDLRPFMGYTATSYSARSAVTSDEVPASCFFTTTPLAGESWDIRPNRTTNFGDDGRVGAVLVGRVCGYTVRLRWMNADHAQWQRFTRWMYQARAVAVWSAYDDAASPWTSNYTLRPYPGPLGYKLLFLDSTAQPDIDNPQNAPQVTGHAWQISGVLYAL